MLILPKLVAVLRVKCACQQICVVPVPHHSKQALVYRLSLQAKVQMSNISSNNPIWYDNSKQDYTHTSNRSCILSDTDIKV